MMTKKTAGELANRALSDNTKYDPWDIAREWTKDVEKELYKSINIYKGKIEEDEFCAVMVIAGDPIIHNLRRRKFYCWPWLPSPRPNQMVFLYNKNLDRMTKRLWVLPNEATMAELAHMQFVHKEYRTMQEWSKAFFYGLFWDFIRRQHGIKMLSQEEYFHLHRREIEEARLNNPDAFVSKPFDFSKICAPQFINSEDSAIL